LVPQKHRKWGWKRKGREFWVLPGRGIKSWGGGGGYFLGGYPEMLVLRWKQKEKKKKKP